MFKIFILFFSLSLTIFADQNNTMSEKQKIRDDILLRVVAISQFLQTIDENDSIAAVAIDTYTNCYIEKMKTKALQELNTTNTQESERFLKSINSVDDQCIGMVYDKYSLRPRVDNMYEKEIKEIIKKYVFYPKAAKRMRMTGTVHVGFILAKNGSFYALRINKSSNFNWLDNAALESVQKASSFFPKPPRTLSFVIPIQYELSNVNDNNVTKKNVQQKKPIK